MLDLLEVVIKLTERCNINCTYCYMFNRGNDDYRERPAYMSLETAKAIGGFVSQAIEDMDVRRVSIVFHGGEPLLMKKRRFDDICKVLRTAVGDDAKLRFGIQTNAMLVDEGWIELFQKHRIGVGVSLDGPPEYHDVHRVDHQQRGTYSRTEAAITLLQAAVQAKRIAPIGGICVINPEYDGRRIYRHFVDVLKIRQLSFNLPMETHDTMDSAKVPLLGKFLVDVFDEWSKDDDPEIRIRTFEEMIRFFKSDQSSAPDKPYAQALIVISGDGELSEDDPFKVINFAQRGGNVRTTRCVEFVNSPLLKYIAQIPHALPTICRTCCWQNYCKGGSQHALSINRYSAAAGFANPSVLCAALKEMYSTIAAYLVNHGFPYTQLAGALDYSKTVVPRSRDLPPIPHHFFSGGRRQIPIRIEPLSTKEFP